MLVTLEGIDGSGKTTLCKQLQSEFPDAVFTREPTNSWYGDAVRKSISADNADSLAELFLYTADHADHLASVIEPALEEGKLVISDRYADSRYAYQAATLSDQLSSPLEYIKTIHEPFTRVPDLTIYLDLPPEVAVQRSDQANKFEQTQFLQSVYDNYQQVINKDPDRFAVIDATQSPESVLSESINAIESFS